MNFQISRPVMLWVGPWFSVQVLLMFLWERKKKSIYFCCALSAFLLYGIIFCLDDHKLFLKTKKKETYLMIIRQNIQRRIKI